MKSCKVLNTLPYKYENSVNTSYNVSNKIQNPPAQNKMKKYFQLQISKNLNTVFDREKNDIAEVVIFTRGSHKLMSPHRHCVESRTL